MPVPACGQPWSICSYEGTSIFQCTFCAGTLVENDKIPRIIARTGREHGLLRTHQRACPGGVRHGTRRSIQGQRAAAQRRYRS